MNLLILSLVYILGYVQAERDCKVTARGLEYRGYVSKTISGKTCQYWNISNPYSLHPTTLLNYCRNPDGSDGGPWCYTEKSDTPIGWEYCDVQLCPNFQPVGSWLFDETHGGLDLSSTGENYITMTNLTYSYGIDGQHNSSICLPTANHQAMIIRKPTKALFFSHEISFITFIYFVGKQGAIFEHKFRKNASDTGYLAFWVRRGDSALHIWLRNKLNDVYNSDNVQNVLHVNAWHKIGLSVTHSQSRIYVNDSLVLEVENKVGLALVTKSDVIYFGNVAGDPAYLGGKMACAKFFDVALNISRMYNVNCQDNACKEIINGRCVGSCIGFFVGAKCDIYILPIQVKAETISISMINSYNMMVSWRVPRAPKQGTRQFYRFEVRYKKQNITHFLDTQPVYFGGENVLTHTYTSVVKNVGRAVDVTLSVRSIREVGEYLANHDSDELTRTTPCTTPDLVEGLIIHRQQVAFVVVWTTDLTTLDSGCTTKSVKLYHRYTESDQWTTVAIDLSLNAYTIPDKGHTICFVKMTTVNNARHESSTLVVTPLTGTSTVTPISETLSTTTPPKVNSSYIEDGDNAKARLSNLVLALGISLGIVCVLLVTAIVIVIVWWRINTKRRDNSLQENNNTEDLQLSQMHENDQQSEQVYQNECFHDLPTTQNTYEKIKAQSQGEPLRGGQYETLDISQNHK